MKFAKELKVGLIAIVCILILVIGFNFLKGINLFASETDYQSYFPNSRMPLLNKSSEPISIIVPLGNRIFSLSSVKVILTRRSIGF